MIKKQRHAGIALINLLIFFFLFILYSTESDSISVYNATPIILLPMLTAFSMFREEWVSAFTGLLTGCAMDSVSSGTEGFNAVVMALIGLMTSVIAHYLFNRNLRSAVALSILGSLFYFLSRWLIFYAFGSGVSNGLFYLLKYAFPSVIYTNLFILPFFFLERHFSRMTKESG